MHCIHICAPKSGPPRHVFTLFCKNCSDKWPPGSCAGVGSECSAFTTLVVLRICSQAKAPAVGKPQALCWYAAERHTAFSAIASGVSCHVRQGDVSKIVQSPLSILMVVAACHIHSWHSCWLPSQLLFRYQVSGHPTLQHQDSHPACQTHTQIYFGAHRNTSACISK